MTFPSRRPLPGDAPARPVPLRRHQRQIAGLEAFIKACHPLIHVTTWEERRFLDDLVERYGAERAIYQWSFTKGLVRLPDGHALAPDTVGDPIAVLRQIESQRQPGLYVLCDLHPWLEEGGSAERVAVVRLLRDIYRDVRRHGDTGRSVILLSHRQSVPSDLEKELVLFDFPLPDRHELGQRLDALAHEAVAAYKSQIRLTPDEREKLLEAALGLTLDEASNAFSAAIASDNQLDASDIRAIMAEKQLIIRKSGVLEYQPAEERFEDVGGLETLKEWLRKRARAFSREAREFGLPAPKGVLLTGVQGCGKSLTAKAIANAWQLPLLRLDMGRLFAGLIGQSEENMRRAIQLAEAMAPCVLWVDELEKSFSGLKSSGQVDGGTTARLFSTFLTWMQEKKSSVFVVATANQIDGLPPELLRKGRFDEIFFVDLPDARERRAILQIHLARLRRDPARFELGALIEASEGFSGAEIEQAIVAGLFEAFDARGELATQHVLGALQQTVPLYVTMQEEIDALRQWAHLRAVPASGAAI